MSTRPTSAPKHGRTRRVTLVVPRLEAANVVATGDFSGWSSDGIRLKQRDLPVGLTGEDLQEMLDKRTGGVPAGLMNCG